MRRVKFSVVTVSFNAEKTIERTIKSVLVQTYSDYEYIIVDGGSTDSTLNIVRKYEPLFEGRMKWKSETDKGIYDAMNKGIRSSTGDIIGLVNSDDWWEKDTLANIAKVVEINPNALGTIYCGNLIFHYLDGSELLRVASRKRLERCAQNYDIGIFHPATFVPKNVYDKIGLFDLQFKLNADTDFILRCYTNKIDFEFVNVVISNMSDGGATNRGMTSKEITDRKKVILKYATSKIDFYRVWIPYLIKVYGKKFIPTSIRRMIQQKQDKK